MFLQVLCIEIARTPYSTQTPEILVLMIGTVAPAERLEGNEVFTSMDIGSDIKLGGNLGIFRISHILTINPQINIRRNRTKIGNYLFTVPVGRDSYRATIRADMIILDRYLWRVILEVTTPSKAHIYILWVTKAIQFPHPRDRNGRPSLLYIVCTIEICRTLVCTFHPEKMPCAVQRDTISMGECCMYWIAVGIINL